MCGQRYAFYTIKLQAISKMFHHAWNGLFIHKAEISFLEEKNISLRAEYIIRKNLYCFSRVGIVRPGYCAFVAA